MKAKLKSVLSIFMIFCLMLGLCACGNKDGSDAKTTDSPADTAQPDYIYTAEHKTLPDSGEYKNFNFAPYCLTESGFYMSYYAKVGENIPEGMTPEYEGQYDILEPRLAFSSYDGKSEPLENYAPVQPETDSDGKRDFQASVSLENLFLNGEGNIVTLESVYCSWSDAPEDIKPNDEEYMGHYCSEQAYYVRTLDETGAELSCARLETDIDSYISTYGARLDEQGNLVVTTEMGVRSFGMDGQPVYELDFGGYVISLTKLRDGRVAVLGFDDNGGYGQTVKIIDGAAKAFDSTSCTLPDDVYELVDGGGEYDLYFTSGTLFCGYRLEEEASEPLFDWLDCDINSNGVYKVSAGEDGVFRGFVYDDVMEVFVLSKAPYDSVPQKEHLTMAALYLDSNTQRAVINFNRSSDKYRIDVKDYSEYNTPDDWSAGYTKLFTEIMSGNMPDILSVSSELPYRQLAAKGLLEDLKPYIEADAELDLSDFFPNVISAMEVDGKLFAACSGFMVQTAAGAASIVGDTPGWTYDDYFAALEKMPEGCEGFDLGVDRNTILQVCLALDLADYVDWTTGECRFDSEDFINLLNFAASFPDLLDNNYQVSEEDSSAARIAAGKQMLTAVGFSSTDYMTENFDELFGGKATLIGFPTNHGVGNVIGMAESYAMSSTCKNKDAAWEFLRGFFTEEYQDTIYYLPTNMNAFEKQLEKAMETEYVQDANGNYLLDENGERIPVSRGTMYDGITYKEIYATTPEQAQQLRDVIAGAEKLLDYDSSIIDIVTAEASAFFAGQKSAEEVAKLVQSKANIYVNEQR